METEKRIGDFRVNRKVAWGIFFHSPCTPPPSIRKAVFFGLPTDFLHSVRVESPTFPHKLPDALLEACNWLWILETQPSVCNRLGPGPAFLFIKQSVAFDHYLLGLAQQARLAGAHPREILPSHPLEQALEARYRVCRYDSLGATDIARS
jgi:hypothetical protein